MSEENTKTTPEKPDSNDLAQDPNLNGDFYRGFFTGRQILPHINMDRYGTANVILVSMLNCGLFYLVFRGRRAAQTATGAANGAAGSSAKSAFAQAMENARKMADPLANKASFKTEHKGVAFKDIIGVPEALSEVKQYVDFLQTPDKFTRLGARLPKGCLLTGEPGTGKTLLAKAVAGQANVPFFTCSGADFIEVYAGSGPRRVRELFSEAREASPSVIFIDEIDAIGSRGGNNRPSAGGVSGEENRTINQVLAELDGLSTTDDPIIVFAATNHPDNLDKAIQREGRFDRKVELPMPDISAREDLFNHYLRKIITSEQQASDTNMMRAEEEEKKSQEKKKNSNQNQNQQQSNVNVNNTPQQQAMQTVQGIFNQNNNNSSTSQQDKENELAQFKSKTTPLTEAMEMENKKISKELAALTPGISPAAISTICNEAALAAAIDGSVHVEPKHLRAAVDDVLVGRKHRSRMTTTASSRVALHESGHALVAWLLPQQRPVIKVSITPRGNAGGFTQQLGKEPGDHMTDSSLFTDLCVMLGGRAAENTKYKDLSTGAQDDLHRATGLAIKEMLAFGMNEKSLLAFDYNRLDAGRMYQHHSTKLQAAAEKESKLLVDEAMETVKVLLKQNADKLQQLHDELMVKTELLPGDLERILGKRPENAGSWSSGVHPEVKASLDRFTKKIEEVSKAEAVSTSTSSSKKKVKANNNSTNKVSPQPATA